MPISHAMEYQIEGVALDSEKGNMRVDLSEPRSILIQGENPKTGKTKHYLLRVTHAGGLVLQ